MSNARQNIGVNLGPLEAEAGGLLGAVFVSIETVNHPNYPHFSENQMTAS